MNARQYHTHDGSSFVVPSTASCSLCDNGRPTRPLVVIDPEDREQVERLIRVMDDHGWTFLDDEEATTDMQAALRSLVTPPRPEEPTNQYAVAEDSAAAEWVRAEAGLPGRPVWKCLTRDEWRTWQQISRPEVITEGVES